MPESKHSSTAAGPHLPTHSHTHILWPGRRFPNFLLMLIFHADYHYDWLSSRWSKWTPESSTSNPSLKWGRTTGEAAVVQASSLYPRFMVLSHPSAEHFRWQKMFLAHGSQSEKKCEEFSDSGVEQMGVIRARIGLVRCVEGGNLCESDATAAKY